MGGPVTSKSVGFWSVRFPYLTQIPFKLETILAHVVFIAVPAVLATLRHNANF